MEGIPRDDIKAIEKLSKILEEVMFNKLLIFRGVSNKEKHRLVPRIARNNYSLDKERISLDAFKDISIPFLKSLPDIDLDWMSLAQHHGLATRLLDWTSNILIALYFATNKDFKDDGAIYCIEVANYEKYQHNKMLRSVKDIFTDLEDKVYIFKPKSISERIIIQEGLFTIRGNPESEIKAKSTITIESDLKKNFRELLNKMGVNKKTLFPSLDSLADDINENFKYYH